MTAPGSLTPLDLPPGRRYPGAAHRARIHVPAGAPAGPLPLVIVLDGGWMEQAGLPAMLDALTAAGDIPPAVTLLLDPGVSGTRWERSFEYDALSSRFGDFLFDEVVPRVAEHHALSDRPDDRLIIGVSSGAVAAFVAAWRRPDRVRRVITLIGTFVAMRGADALAGIVRRAEPRPLRVWMEAGRLDHVSPDQPWGVYNAGSWPDASRLLHDALRFGGHRTELVMGDGGHDLEHGLAVLPDALRWAWEGWSPEAGIPAVDVERPGAIGTPQWEDRGSIWATVTAPHDWQRVGGDDVAAIAVHGDGTLVTLSRSGELRSPDDPALRGTLPAGSAIAGGPGRELFAALPDGRVVHRTAEGERVIAEGVPARALAWAGDGLLHALHGRRLATVDVRTGRCGWSDLDAVAPSALALAPDRAELVIADAERRTAWSLLRDPDGATRAAEPFYRLEELDDAPGAHGAAVDSRGWAYLATDLGIQVCEPIGRVAMLLALPEPTGTPTALAFAGPERDLLHVVQGGRLFRRRLRTHGVAPEAPVVPPPPEL